MPAANDPTHGFWSWSFPVGRILGIDVRIHWTLLAVTAFSVARVGFHLPWWWYAVIIPLPAVAVLLHEFGHALMSRAVGGDSRDIILWAYGGIAWCHTPPRWLPHLLVAAAGPGVNLILWAGCRAALDLGHLPPPGTAAAAVVGIAADINLGLLLFNLLPCYPMDGGRIARSLLWPLAGRERAVRWTVVLAYVCLVGMALWAVKTGDFFLFGLAALLFFSVAAEHRLVRYGVDPELGDDFVPERRVSLFERWRRARAARAAERAERAAEAEQAELDRLLAKVSAGGLPSLTEAERRTLQAISQRERDRAERG